MPTLFRIFGNLLIVMHHITNIRHFLRPCIGQIRTNSDIFGQGSSAVRYLRFTFRSNNKIKPVWAES